MASPHFLIWAAGAVAASSIAGCYDPLTEDALVGTYQGLYCSGVEEIVFSPDHTVVQTFTRNGTREYTSSGTWAISGDAVVVKRFVRAMAYGSRRFVPHLVEEEVLHWDDMAQVLVISADYNYWLIKQPRRSSGNTHP